MAYSTGGASGWESSSTRASTVAASPAVVMTASGEMVRVSRLARNARMYSRRALTATAIQRPMIARLA